MTTAVTASFSSNVFMFRSLARVYSCPGNATNPCVLKLRNRRTSGRRRAADSRCTRRKGRSRYKAPVTLPRRRAIGVSYGVTGHARTGKGVDVRIRSRESVRKYLKEGDNLVLLFIGKAEITGGHVDIVLDLGQRPARYFFDRSGRAVSGSDRERKFVARVVKVYELLQAL